jgi:hypothetical protein
MLIQNSELSLNITAKKSRIKFKIGLLGLFSFVVEKFCVIKKVAGYNT